jgi:hypothetical protein
MVCRLVPSCFAKTDMLAPAASPDRTASGCLDPSVAGRPNTTPSALARFRPDCVRSISRSRSNSATALITPIVSVTTLAARLLHTTWITT